MIILILGLVGLCAGSFINAVVWRLHKQLTSKKKSAKFSITKGRSMCPHCRHQLSVRDLVPVLSWLELRGRCRYCQKPISWQYPVVELITSGLFIASFVWWPLALTGWGWIIFAVWLVILILSLALVVYDITWMLLPNRLVYLLIGVSIVFCTLLALQEQDWSVMLGGAIGALVLSGTFWVLFQASHGRWIGGGDVKLAVALGFIAGGFIEVILLLFTASLLGCIVSIPLLVQGKKSHKVPFGPFLIIAAALVFFWGESVINWYTRLIGV